MIQALTKKTNKSRIIWYILGWPFFILAIILGKVDYFFLLALVCWGVDNLLASIEIKWLGGVVLGSVMAAERINKVDGWRVVFYTLGWLFFWLASIEFLCGNTPSIPIAFIPVFICWMRANVLCIGMIRELKGEYDE